MPAALRRPRLAPGFTVASDERHVWLIAGEDARYKLAVDDPAWLRGILARCDGSATVDELIASGSAAQRADGELAIARLYEERVVVDGTAAAAHIAVPRYAVIGSGPLAAAIGGGAAGSGQADSEVFVQDQLDHAALLRHNAAAIAARRRWMWVSTGPGGRAYVGPLFVPDAGPCAACLILHFKRLSPVPELYDVLLAHDGAFATTPFPPDAVAMTAALARWKLGLATLTLPVSALYALHVIDAVDLTVRSFAPVADPECTACRT